MIATIINKDKMFEFSVDNYDISIIPDAKRYGNGYIDLFKVYPKENVLAYLSSMICKHDRPLRFWFSKNHTNIDEYIHNDFNKTIDCIDFCNRFGEYHILNFKAHILSYKIINQENTFYRCQIFNMEIEKD